MDLTLWNRQRKLVSGQANSLWSVLNGTACVVCDCLKSSDFLELKGFRLYKMWVLETVLPKSFTLKMDSNCAWLFNHKLLSKDRTRLSVRLLHGLSFAFLAVVGTCHLSCVAINLIYLWTSYQTRKTLWRYDANICSFSGDHRPPAL